MLQDESKFGLKAMTAAVNKLDATPTQIRDLGIFEEYYLTTTHADIEYREGALKLVQSKARGMGGDPVEDKTRTVHTIKIPHLPINDVVRADDVQGVRAFGGTQAEAVQDKVNEKLADAKLKLEMTREHMMLGALQGKVLDADGSTLVDWLKTFNIKRTSMNFKIGTANAEVGKEIDTLMAAHRKLQKGAMVTGWVALCGAEYLTALKYHPSIKPLYERYRDGAAYRENSQLNPIEFEYNGIKFIQYTGDFGEHGAKIPTNGGILLPVGRKLYGEFFAPADMNQTVNTKALPYYASREKMKHDKGWDLHAQSNPLPVAFRPELIATLVL